MKMVHPNDPITSLTTYFPIKFHCLETQLTAVKDMHHIRMNSWYIITSLTTYFLMKFHCLETQLTAVGDIHHIRMNSLLHGGFSMIY